MTEVQAQGFRVSSRYLTGRTWTVFSARAPRPRPIAHDQGDAIVAGGLVGILRFSDKCRDAMVEVPGDLGTGSSGLVVWAPCACMAEFHGGGSVHFTVADAEMNAELNEITVRFDGREVVVPLPAELDRGKPAKILLRLQALLLRAP